MNSEHIILNKINAFKKNIWATDSSANLDHLSDMLDDIVASLPTCDETTYFKTLHDFFCCLSDKRLFEKPQFVNEIFRKLLNLYAYYLDNDSLAVCSVFMHGILVNETYCSVNDIQNILKFLEQVGSVDLPIFPILGNQECCESLENAFHGIQAFIADNPYLIFYSMPWLCERLAVCVGGAIENYKKIQVVMNDDFFGIGALLLFSQFSEEILDDYSLTCLVPQGAIGKCKSWLEIPSNRAWLDKKAKYCHEIKKMLKHIKEEPLKKNVSSFYLSAQVYQKFPVLPQSPSQDFQGAFLLLDTFEPTLPDFSFYNATWATWDCPDFLRYKDTDRFITLGCVIIERDSLTDKMSLLDFYKSLRGIKNESEVWEKWKNAKLREPAKPSDFLIKADILCRSGKFDKAFKLVEKYHEAKITAAYRICNSIIHHCKQQQLKDKVAGFMDEKELFQKAFCAELSEIADIADNDKKSCWL